MNNTPEKQYLAVSVLISQLDTLAQSLSSGVSGEGSFLRIGPAGRVHSGTLQVVAAQLAACASDVLKQDQEEDWKALNITAVATLLRLSTSHLRWHGGDTLYTFMLGAASSLERDAVRLALEHTLEHAADYWSQQMDREYKDF